MGRLVDKDVLLDLFHIKEPCMECPWFTKDCDKPVYSPMEICERIDDAPTVDAAPVEWFEGVIRSLRAKGREEYADAMQIILDAWEDVIG